MGNWIGWICSRCKVEQWPITDNLGYMCRFCGKRQKYKKEPLLPKIKKKIVDKWYNIQYRWLNRRR